MKWRCDKKVQPDNTLHVWPFDEEREHVLHGVDCECAPKVKTYKTGKAAGRTLVAHKSFKVFSQRKLNNV